MERVWGEQKLKFFSKLLCSFFFPLGREAMGRGVSDDSILPPKAFLCLFL